MRHAGSVVVGILLAGLLGASGCHHDEPRAVAAPVPVETKVIAVAVMRPSQDATTQPTDDNVEGTVTFTQEADGVDFVAVIDGFAPNTKHGFHIHAKGDLSAPNLSSAGGHYNPTNEPHGGPESPHHHLGDLGNLQADADGHAQLRGFVKDVTLSGEGNSILGKSVIIHAKPDDLHSQPSGDSGARIAGGVIVLSK